MKSFKIILLFLVIGNFAAQDLSVTIYNQNLGVVKEVRKMNVKKGISTIQIGNVAEKVEPTSVKLEMNGTVLEQNYKYDLASLQKILNKYVDKQIDLIDEKGNFISGKLLATSGNSIVLQNENLGLTMLPNTQNYQIKVADLPEGLITKPTLEYVVDSPISGEQNLNLSYQTGGISWHAEYIAVLSSDEKTLDLSSWVSIENNSGATYENAKLKLVAGKINQTNEEVAYFAVDAMPMAKSGGRNAQFEDRNFFEFYIYELNRTSTISNNEIKQISFIEGNNLKIDKKYTFSSYLFSYTNKDDFRNFNVTVKFKNSKENNLGVALPMGIARIFKKDGNSLELVGEDNIPHTPKDEFVSFQLGQAFDLVATEKIISQEDISDGVTEIEKEILIKNHKNEQVQAEVFQSIGRNFKVIDSNFEYEKENTSLKFLVNVKPNSEQTIHLKVRVTN